MFFNLSNYAATKEKERKVTFKKSSLSHNIRLRNWVQVKDGLKFFNHKFWQ